MNCEEFQERAREFERTVPSDAAEHLQACRDCGLQLERERVLSAGLAAARGEREAPARVEAAMIAAFRERTRRDRSRNWVWGLAAAAALLAAAFLWRGSKPDPPVDAAANAAPPTEVATEYIPLRRGRILEPGEFSQVVRIRLAQSEMRRFGMPVEAGWERSAVNADVVIGQDGMARAIRFVK